MNCLQGRQPLEKTVKLVKSERDVMGLKANYLKTVNVKEFSSGFLLQKNHEKKQTVWAKLKSFKNNLVYFLVCTQKYGQKVVVNVFDEGTKIM